MNAEVYLQINFIPIIALVLMRLNTERTLTYSWRSRALRFMMVLLAGIMLLNLTGRCLDGQQFAGAHVLLLLLDHGSLILLVFLSYLWYLYVCDVLNHGIGQRGLPVLKAALPLLALLVLFLEISRMVCSFIWMRRMFTTEVRYFSFMCLLWWGILQLRR